MEDTSSENKVSIDGKDYNLEDLTDNAKAQITNIQFVDGQIQQLSNELAIADTARLAYTRALKSELTPIESPK
jgi:hypothetical protein